MKFLRFAEWKISLAGRGLVGMITNHSWLDNPTFSGMRWHLMQTFDEIRVLDLHGSSLKREVAPGGGRDVNVFDIRQGVAISFFLKRPSSLEGDEGARAGARVFHDEIWGDRESKYAWLDAHSVGDTEWTELEPLARSFLFRPVDRTAQETYGAFVSVPRIFSPNGAPAPGIVTTHDEFAISWSAEEAALKVQRLLATHTEEEARLQFRLCSQSQWSYQRAKEELADGAWREQIVPILYRPFDTRWTVFDRNVAVHRRERVMRHMLAGGNLALSTTRSIEIVAGFEHAFCTRLPIQHHTVSIKEVNYLFPLYLYADSSPKGLFADQEPSGRRPNLDARLLPALRSAYGREVTPDQVFHYVYAVLYTPSYRVAYADLLRMDFPRVPFPADTGAFSAMGAIGERLVELHLLESPRLETPRVRFEGRGDSRVAGKRSEGFSYDLEGERVGINPTQRFAPVPVELWEYRIGGYQVLDKWLKDRRGRTLSTDDIQAYCRIATALAETLEIQAELDTLYPAIEADLLELSLGG